MLAIATQNPDATAETYVRQHISLLFPGSTAVVYFQGTADTIRDIPSIRVGKDRHHFLPGKIESFYNYAAAGYPTAITGRQERELVGFFRRNNVSVVLAEFGPTGASLMKLCEKLGIPLFVNFHGYDATVMPKRWFVRSGYRKLARSAQGFICGSNYFRQKLLDLGMPKEKTYVIPCGVEVERFSNTTEKDPNLVLAVGRLTEKKAPHLAIEAFARALQGCPELRLEVIGGGDLYDKCSASIEKRGLQANVTLLGERSHDFVIDRLSKASIFIQHSVKALNGDEESQGISLVEAMASGVVTVVTDHNGFSETVLNGETGYLVDEGNVSQMASHIQFLTKNEDSRKAMSNRSRQRALQKYDANALASILRSTLLGLG